ncbi:MAG TPA: anti-sigma factor [Pyrinomonadaceae bacterium]|nr:anti-sigma factor [Pyrinomonadaceae bacterium]
MVYQFVTCEEVQELIHGFIDGELGLVPTLEIEDHLGECETCRSEHQGQLNLRTLVREGARYFNAPELTARTVGAALRGRPRLSTPDSGIDSFEFCEHDSNRGRPRRAAPTVRSQILAIAAMVILALSGVLSYSIFSARSQSHNDDLLAQEVVSSHVRSMMLNHLVDVPSSDQHTVKPWFNGKLDFAPEVKDLVDQGFPLVGGRLDYIDNRTVAALVYQRRKHSINLFIWPSTRSDQAEQQFSNHGYNIIHWTRSGASYWAVSDVNSADLGEFARLVSR